MNAVMWPATWGYYLTQLVTGSVPSPDVLVPAARDHFKDHVRARGHFPALRIGRQPYGVLPVCWSAGWKSLEGRALDPQLASMLARLRPTWESSVPNVPRLPGAADPEAALVGLLGMSPTSTSYVARNMIGPEYNLSYWKFARQPINTAWWTGLSSRSLHDTGDLSGTMATTRLANAAFVRAHRPLSDLMVAPAPLNGLPAPAYVSLLESSGWQGLRGFQLPPAPVPLLLLLLRHAALRQYIDTATDLLGPAGAVQPAERFEPELVGLSAGLPRPSPWDILQRTLPGHGAVGTYLDGAKQDPTLPAFADFWASFARLAGYSAEALDLAIREVLDLAAYRFDAWVTSLAHFRLEALRGANPNDGIVLGGYGWLEDVRPQPQRIPSAGYVHAPSLAHATTAAVLRSGYLTHRDGTQPAMAIDLSSDRARLGLHLMDGVRSGQPLGALLGYRLERSLHDGGLDQFIDTLRAMAPLDGPPVTGTGTTESVAATDVVDGLVLLGKFHDDPNFWSTPGLPPPGLPPAGTLRDQLTTQIKRLDDALDSVADLALSESVHQLVRGNTVRAGATLDAIARGDAPPPDLDVVATPRAGTSLTHRLLAVAASKDAPGWSTTPRAQAEPRLNSWAAKMLGDPAHVRALARFLDSTGTQLATIEIGLNALALAPLDLLALPETNVLDGEFSDRLLRAAQAARPANVPAGATVQLVPTRASNWTPDVVSASEWLGLLQAVRRLVGAARALEPADLAQPGSTAGAIDTDELKLRADAAETMLRQALDVLAHPGASDAALLGAASFGVVGAVPSLDPTQWAGQVAAAAEELTARAAALDKLASGFTRAGASSDTLRDHDVSRLKTIFGDSFLVLPAVAPDLAATWPQLFANSPVLLGGDSVAPVRWMQRASRVHSGAGRLATALLCAEALTGSSLANFEIAQLPFVSNERWIGLDLAAGTTPASRLSLVAFLPKPVAAGAGIAGLMLDDWVEVVPSAQQITGVTFHFDDPIARAPQAILLAVRPDDFVEWTFEAVEGSVLEALDLAKLRAVDPDALGALGHYLPALYFAYNTSGPHGDAISIDFNNSLLTAQPRNE